MKNSKGISVIALVITVIVIIIITSITVYTGIDMISDARKKDATDRLKVICTAIRKDEGLFNMESGEAILAEQDYTNLDLADYYDEDYPVYLVTTTTKLDNQTTKKYTLNMYKGEDKSEIYATEFIEIIRKTEKNVYSISFDENKGVNRPLLFDDMYALTSDGKNLVNDVYEDDWYSYNSTVPSFAKMKYDSNKNGKVDDENMTYVWIPRFAYSIQTYYDGVSNPTRSYVAVPNAAMKVVFLRENTNYMHNDEVVPAGYHIHPAFTRDGIELPGIWMAAETSESDATLSVAISNCASVAASSADFSSHLMTNTEYSAALYLMFSMNEYDDINLMEQDEFVAAGLEDNAVLNGLEYADLYDVDTLSITGVTEKIGDAMLETNWDRLIADYPTESKPCIVRLLKTGGFFDFTSVSESGSHYYYRAVIVNK